MIESDDDAAEFARQLFAGRDEIPRDIVPGSGLTVEALRRMSDAAGTTIEYFTPGTPIEDVDGNLIAMSPGRTEAVFMGRTVITQSDADRLGIDPAGYPGITVMPNPTNGRNNNE